MHLLEMKVLKLSIQYYANITYTYAEKVKTRAGGRVDADAAGAGPRADVHDEEGAVVPHIIDSLATGAVRRAQYDGAWWQRTRRGWEGWPAGSVAGRHAAEHGYRVWRCMDRGRARGHHRHDVWPWRREGYSMEGG
jgi:hypothetical protein